MKRIVAWSLLCAAPAFAAAPGGAEFEAKVKRLFETMGEHIEEMSFFEGPGPFVGVNIRSNGDPKVTVWVTQDGNYLIAGNLLDKKGRNLTNLAAEHYQAKNPIDLTVSQAVKMTVDEILPKALGTRALENLAAKTSPTAGDSKNNAGQEKKDGVKNKTSPEKIIEVLDKLPNEAKIIVGEEHIDNGTVYVFFDPLCSFCKTLFFKMGQRKYPQNYKVVWIPVTSVGNPDVGARLIQSPTYEFLTQIETDTDAKPIKERMPLAKAKAILDKNTQLFALLVDLPATPTIVAKNAKGQAKLIVGDEIDLLDKFMKGEENKKKRVVAPPKPVTEEKPPESNGNNQSDVKQKPEAPKENTE